MLSKIAIKTPQQIALMRAAGKLTAHILDEVGKIIAPGISTEDINELAHTLTIQAGGRPATLGYHNFPKSVCTSINDVVCHGIPSRETILAAGDIINVDVTSILDGYHADASRMYFVGGRSACSTTAQNLVDTAVKALEVGIAAVHPGGHVGDIGAAIQEFVQSTGYGFGIVVEYTGHGVGRAFHEPPQIVHVGRRGQGAPLKVGMTFTIEPMINAGGPETVLSQSDGWTVRTADGSLSAQAEHTIVVTPEGAEILTL